MHRPTATELVIRLRRLNEVIRFCFVRIPAEYSFQVTLAKREKMISKIQRELGYSCRDEQIRHHQ